jgi:hypothetical protein
MSITTNNGVARRRVAPIPAQDLIPLPPRPSEDVGSRAKPDDAQADRNLGQRLAQMNDLYHRHTPSAQPRNGLMR